MNATRPTRIAFLITDLDPGGAERALVEVVLRLDRAVWEPYVYCLAPLGSLASRLTAAGIPTRGFGARRATQVGVLISLVRELRRIRPAILQTFLFHANISGRVAARLAGVPCTISGIRVAERRAGWHLWLDRWTSWLVADNVCVSRAVADFSARVGRLPQAKLLVIPNGVDVERFGAARPADLGPFGVPAGAEVVIAVGRLDRQKGFDLLIEAAALLRPRKPYVRFLVVGEGPERERLAGQITRLGLEDCVHLTGFRSDVAELMRSASVFVLPSRWEGMPNALLEALASGLPAVATDVEGVREALPEGAGLIVPPESPQAIADALDAMLNDPNRASCGRIGQEYVSQHYDWQSVASMYGDLFARHLRRLAGADRA